MIQLFYIDCYNYDMRKHVLQGDKEGAGRYKGRQHGGGFFFKLKIEKKVQNASDSKHFSQATKMWRLYSVALGSIVIPPYLGYCKLFQVFN